MLNIVRYFFSFQYRLITKAIFISKGLVHFFFLRKKTIFKLQSQQIKVDNHLLCKQTSLPLLKTWQNIIQGATDKTNEDTIATKGLNIMSHPVFFFLRQYLLLQKKKMKQIWQKANMERAGFSHVLSSNLVSHLNIVHITKMS